jgi:hypothetical protein
MRHSCQCIRNDLQERNILLNYILIFWNQGEHVTSIRQIFTFGCDDPCAGSDWKNRGACCWSSSTLTLLGMEDCVGSEGLVSEDAGAP